MIDKFSKKISIDRRYTYYAHTSNTILIFWTNIDKRHIPAHAPKVAGDFQASRRRKRFS